MLRPRIKINEHTQCVLKNARITETIRPLAGEAMSDHAPRIDNSNSRIVKSHLESQNLQQSKTSPNEAHNTATVAIIPLECDRHLLRNAELR